MTVHLLTDEAELAATNVAVAVAKGAGSLRKLAAYFQVGRHDQDSVPPSTAPSART